MCSPTLNDELTRINDELTQKIAGCTQRYLDCGLHEVAAGERDSDEHKAARLHIATRLVEAGADPDNRQHGCGGTPLHHTLAGGYVELVKFLLVAKADVNAANRYGACPRATPWRVRKMRVPLTPHAAAAPAHPTGVHPLHIAVKREYTDCIEYLMTWELPLQKVKDELAWAVQVPRARCPTVDSSL